MANIFSWQPFGYEGDTFEISAEIREGISAVDIIGMSEDTVSESASTIREAFHNANIPFSKERMLVCASPADLKKDAQIHGLALALAMQAAMDTREGKTVPEGKDILVLGCLDTSGRVRPVKHVYPAIEGAVNKGIKYAIVAKGSTKVAVEGIEVFYAANLYEAVEHMHLIDRGEAKVLDPATIDDYISDDVSFDAVPFTSLDAVEYTDLKTAMAVAAAGGHHLFTWGALGNGAYAVLEHMPELLPLLRKEESKTVTRIHSFTGLTYKEDEPYIRKRPFRVPHQSASIEGMFGGGIGCRPGEVSFAHNGVLFLDDAAEFRSIVLQMLRVPLNAGSITLSRAGRATTFPAKFTLLMNAQPCPCGAYGEPGRHCLCSARTLSLYWKKFGNPLMAKIPMRLHIRDGEDRFTGHSLEEYRQLIKKAVEKQLARQGKLNQDLCPSEMVACIKVTPEAEAYLRDVPDYAELTERAIADIRKVARTLADMRGEELVSKESMSDAYYLRGKLPDALYA